MRGRGRTPALRRAPGDIEAAEPVIRERPRRPAGLLNLLLDELAGETEEAISDRVRRLTVAKPTRADDARRGSGIAREGESDPGRGARFFEG